ncbi:MAG: DUF4332 domain-containing protein [Hyphomonadaceae bacterium]|nr:DUF4332 domain-containing protein [Hyphomonadaceae bacterium]
MSLLFSVVYGTRCRSTHHKIALDALKHLQGPDAAKWRMLFLHFHQNYLKGAKAPDDEFKDFKNHVLHVREGDWGGAREAAEAWRQRLASALKAKDWPQAAWCAGVMSHYCVDVLQPFHTHQTEEENVIHRAVEWSYFKSYDQLHGIAEGFGWPKIDLPQTQGWLPETIRNGARHSTQFYEFVVDHYDFETGVKQPQKGLDNPLRETIAKLLGAAIVSWARILDRVLAEANVKPPSVDGSLQAFFLSLETPIQSVLKLVGDVQERALLQAQYEEFRRTGKVRTTLSEDDAAVRQLYAAEVVKLPLSSLDAQWPREIGAAHDAKAKRTKTKRGAKQKDGAQPPEAKAPEAKAPARAPDPKPPETRAAPPAAAAPPQAPAAQPAAPAPQAASPFFSPGAGSPTPPPAPAAAAPPPSPRPEPRQEPKPEPPRAPAAEDEPAPLLLTKKMKPLRGPSAEPGALKFSLYGGSRLEDAPSIGPKTAKRFYAVGIRTVSELLAMSPAGAAVLVDYKRITAPVIADWQAQAMLACTVPELKAREAQALVALDIVDAESLAECDPAELAPAMRDWAKASGLPGADQLAFGDKEVAALIGRANAGIAQRNKSAALV